MADHDVVIVGVGGLAAAHAADVARLAPRARVVAAVEPDQGRLLGFAERWAVRRLYHTLDNMLACERPRLIDLCTPPDRRAEQAIACLRRGHAVLCEGPPARSLAELDAVARVEFAGGGRLVTVSPYRFGPAARRLRGVAGDGRLGPPVTAACHAFRHGAEDDTGFWGAAVGRCFAQLDLLLSVLGPWAQVVAVAGESAPAGGALVTFASGAVATVTVNAGAPRASDHVRIDLAHATVEVSRPTTADDDEWTVTAAPGHEYDLAAAWGTESGELSAGRAAQLAAVLDAIEAGGRPPICLAQARATLELITAICASARTSRPVRPGEIGPDSPFYHRLDGDAPAPATTAPPTPATLPS